ncbi:hypothetical protein QFC19_003386 [Naganishia cerealis]|uniref:Uncharacterized protein n=1 Tax=Naganishia cerealis TaxID=610337 RepID=A0ACC2W296_9TREE|nr:hypothetical protein QFC19_003386 [Naganishia cerealis]
MAPPHPPLHLLPPSHAHPHSHPHPLSIPQAHHSIPDGRRERERDPSIIHTQARQSSVLGNGGGATASGGTPVTTHAVPSSITSVPPSVASRATSTAPVARTSAVVPPVGQAGTPGAGGSANTAAVANYHSRLRSGAVPNGRVTPGTNGIASAAVGNNVSGGLTPRLPPPVVAPANGSTVPGANSAPAPPPSLAAGHSLGPHAPPHPHHLGASHPIVPGPPALSRPRGLGQQPPVPSVHAIQQAIVQGTEAPLHALAQANEQTWLLIGAVSEQLGDTERAEAAYEHALRHNPASVSALTQVAGMARVKEDFHRAVDYYQRVLSISQENGEVWGSLGHCYLMMDDLQKAYTAYQQALYRLPNPKDPKLWYGIGILYDRYGSLEHAEEAFSSVLRMEPNFDKANEVYFRLGIIYKTQQKFDASLQCFRYILNNPPKPLTEVDIWFQVGHVHEQQRDYTAAKDAYERVLKDNPDHAKVLQQLGWLYHQPSASFSNSETAISYLTKSLEADPADAQSWYLLGRAFMGGQKYNKAYEAYQQAVYRDGKNPTFWCSIGVLYYQINQYRDALDAYSRAIRLNPFISEVWFNLGSLYESCNNQVNDAIDAYARAHDLDPANTVIKTRLNMLRNAEREGVVLSDPPPPQDVHPTAYAQTVANRAFPGSQADAGNAPAPLDPSAPARPLHGEDVQPVVNGRDLAAPPLSAHQAATPAESAFRSGGGPPPVQIAGEQRGAAPPRPDAFAPMSVEARDRSAAPGRQTDLAPSRRSIAEEDERSRAERTPIPHNDYSGRREPSYRPGSSSSALRSGHPDDWHRERSERVISGNYPGSPRLSPTTTRSQVHSYASRATLDPRMEASPRSLAHSPAYDYGRLGSASVDERYPPALRQAQTATPQRVLDERNAVREAEERARATSIGRYPESSYELERRRADDRKQREWQEQEARLREEEDLRPQASGGLAQSLRTEQAKTSSRAASPARPASSHSRPGSSRRKRKAPKSASIVEQKDEDQSRKEEESNVTTQAVSLPSPRATRVIDEDYDEGAADALMGLAGYRGTGIGNESTYTPVQPSIEKLPNVARLDPHQISSNVMNASTPSLKRATTSSPPPEGSQGRDGKKARYESPGKEAASITSTTVLSPSVRSVPPAISIPSRTVTTMIEVLNPSRITPTATSPMTAHAVVSPSRRDKEGKQATPSPRKRSVKSVSTSPKKLQVEDDKASEKERSKSEEKEGDLGKEDPTTVSLGISKKASDAPSSNEPDAGSPRSQAEVPVKKEAVVPETSKGDSRNSPQLPSPTPDVSLPVIASHNGASIATPDDKEADASTNSTEKDDGPKAEGALQEKDTTPLKETDRESDKEKEGGQETANEQKEAESMDTSS